MQYLDTLVLGRMLARPSTRKWHRECRHKIRLLEVASGIIFALYLRNKVLVSAIVPGCCATHPIEVEDSDSDFEVASTSSGDSMIVRVRFDLR